MPHLMMDATIRGKNTESSSVSTVVSAVLVDGICNCSRAVQHE